MADTRSRSRDHRVLRRGSRRIQAARAVKARTAAVSAKKVRTRALGAEAKENGTRAPIALPRLASEVGKRSRRGRGAYAGTRKTDPQALNSTSRKANRTLARQGDADRHSLGVALANRTRTFVVELQPDGA